METRRYQLSFLTPAFLGDAEQNARWRTPPIKHLLREWWRVAWTAEHGIAVERMRDAEGRLFGTAFGDSGSRSEVRLRLLNPSDATQNAWSPGSQQGVAPMEKNPGTSYAWFGLVDRGDGERDRKGVKPAGVERSRELRLAFPAADESLIATTLQLADAFGLVGSRSRGGWGSIRLTGDQFTGLTDPTPFCRELEDCLDHDWASAIGRDERGPLIWEGRIDKREWHHAMRRIAGLRKEIRTTLPKDLRPVLGFASPGRMPSPLRWKVIEHEDDRLAVRVFATPHRIPESTRNTLPAHRLEAAWQTTIRALDSQKFLARPHA